MALKYLGFAACVVFLVAGGFLAGRLSAPDFQSNPESLSASFEHLLLVQNNDPRELQPLPGPGQGFGLPQGSEECPLLFFEDGQFFQMQPGQPGQQGSPELFPLQPLPGAPGTPRQPAPRPAPEQFSHHLGVTLVSANP